MEMFFGVSRLNLKNLNGRGSEFTLHLSPFIEFLKRFENSEREDVL